MSDSKPSILTANDRMVSPWKMRLPETIEVAFAAFSLAILGLSMFHVYSQKSSFAGYADVAIALIGVAALCVMLEIALQSVSLRLAFLAAHVAAVVIVLRLPADRVVLVEVAVTCSLLFAIALHLSLRWTLAISGIVLVLLGFSGFLGTRQIVERVFILIIQIGFVGLSLLAIEYRERLVDAKRTAEVHRRSIESLAAANHSFIAYLEDAKTESEEKERLRITRELHDSIGYAMTSISMMMNASVYLIEDDPGKLIEYCNQTKEMAAATLAETREILYKLRAARNEQRAALPIFFTRVCIDFQKATGVHTECNTGNLPRNVSEAVFSALFRAVQVGLINALRHGQAHHVRLNFWEDNGTILMTLWNDNRVRIDHESVREGIGLRGIVERLESLGGELSMGPVADGFRLDVRIPFSEADEEDD